MPAHQRRAELLDAAAEVFRLKGYEGATTEDIARQAGVTKGALYFHFKSKEDIFVTLVKETSQNLVNEIRAILNKKKKGEEIIEELIRYGFHMLEADRRFNIEYWQQTFLMPDVREYLAQVHVDAVNEVAQFIKKNSKLNLNEARSLVWIIHAINDGLMIQQHCYMGKVNRTTMINQVVNMCKLYLNKRQ
jgi:AcrR family transcriptional regulator